HERCRRSPSRAVRSRPLPFPRGYALAPLSEAGSAPRGRRDRVRGVGAQRGLGRGGGRLQRLGPAAASDAADERRLGHLVCPRARSARGKHLQVPHRVQARGLQGGQGRPVRVSLRDAAEDRVGGVGPRLRMARCRVDAHAGYEVHLGSWMRSPDSPDRFLGYRDLAPKLADYAKRMGFTHVELMPIMEHPFYGSWGYQCTGYFAASSRYGTPQDLMWLIDHLHQAGIGVILDWVPSHFPWDPHGLGFFDGTHLYEHSDPRQGHHPEWASAIFNYGRNEVRA